MSPTRRYADSSDMRLRGTWSRAALAVLAASVVLPLVVAAVAPRAALAFAGAAHAVSVIAAAVVMIVAGVRGTPRLRRSRLLFAAALLATATGFAIFTVASARGRTLPMPSYADAFTLAWAPLAAAGLMSLPLRTEGTGARLRSVLDGVIAASALALASWLAVLQPVYARTDTDGLARATLLTYPVVDVVIAVIALSVMSHATGEVRRLLRYLTAGLVLIALSDSGTAVNVASGRTGFAWTDITLQAGIALLVLGAVLPPEGERQDRRHALVIDAVLPYLPVVVAMAVRVHHTLQGGTIGRSESILTAVVLGALIWRQVLYSLQLGSLAKSLERDATHDSLTGLCNRSAFIATLEAELPVADPGCLAVVMLDLNGFKEINDGYGHDAGDRALVVFADRLSAAGGRCATAARLGGDEFALVVTGPDAEVTALSCAAAASSGAPVRIGAVDVPLTASAGIAVSREDDGTSTLLRRADLAMYEAKRSPISLTAVFSDDMAGRADRRNLLAQALPGAAERGELHLVYQPLYTLESDALAGAEVLLRWRSPRHGDVAPDEFIGLAEDIGAIRAIGSWVLESALRQLSQWQAAGLVVPRLFVNASSRQFTEDFAESVVEQLTRYGIERKVLTLEVTESSVPDLEANRALVTLRDAGVRIAMDDFGAGFSSLAQLARLPVDTLKIDREFVRGIETINGRLIFDSVIALANELGLVTVAEGIETTRQVEIVRASGCTLAQGYHYARPLPPRELAARLSAAIVPPPRRAVSPRVPQTP